MKLCLQFWYTKKILVANKEIAVVIHHLEIFFVSIHSKTILFNLNTQYCFYKRVLNKSSGGGWIIVCNRFEHPSL